MELTVNRNPTKGGATLGALFVDSLFQCVTLEDPIRDFKPDGSGKIPDDTCIPPDRYRILITPSPAHQNRLFMRVMGVKWFTGILIHSGNTDADTKGCILVGNTVDDDDHIHGGSVALPILFDKVQKALAAGEEVWLTVNNPVTA